MAGNRVAGNGESEWVDGRLASQSHNGRGIRCITGVFQTQRCSSAVCW